LHRLRQAQERYSGLVDWEKDSSPVIGSHVPMAVGRQPNTDDLGLDHAGIETDARGYIIVDDELQTNVAGVYAMNVGDPIARRRRVTQPISAGSAF
jgi:pyruvate/2-oxoglutarate dehydrogenase complex dihydrolipoamide dehydrogenase (E3) component